LGQRFLILTVIVLMVFSLSQTLALGAVNYGVVVSVFNDEVTFFGVLSVDNKPLAEADVSLRIANSQGRNILAAQTITSSTGGYSFGPYVLPNGEYVAYVGGRGENEAKSLKVAFWEYKDVTKVSLDKDLLALKVGEKKTLVTTLSPKDATIKQISWSSSKESIAKVNSNGTVTGVAPGEATVTATNVKSDKSASCKVIVTAEKIAVTEVKLSESDIKMDKGGSVNLVVTVAPDNASNKALNWSSGDSSVAIVDNNGKVVALSEGKAIITVTTADGGKNASCQVTVSEKKARETRKGFSDTDGHWKEAGINQLIERGILKGYSDGIFKPDKIITRAEFTVALVKALELPVATGNCIFDDVKNHWAKNYISTAVAQGMAHGYSPTAFGPDDPITREQMAVSIYNVLKMSPVTNKNSFSDNDLISPWAREAVDAVSQRGLISGYPDYSFRPQAYLTRAEAATVLCKLLGIGEKKIEEKK